VLYPGDAAPISLDPTSAAAAAAFQARMAACNGVAGAPYRSPADYWATTGAYAAYSPAFDPLVAGTYCARAAAGASASMSSCAMNGGGSGSGSGQTGPPSRGYSHEQNALARIYQNETSW